jgi:hypothetical protein
MAFVLSGTAGLGLSGTGRSYYQEPHLPGTYWNRWRNRPLSNNANNRESYGFFLTSIPAVDGGS